MIHINGRAPEPQPAHEEREGAGGFTHASHIGDHGLTVDAEIGDGRIALLFAEMVEDSIENLG